MSDDKKDNVIAGIFPRSDEVEDGTEPVDYGDAGEMMHILGDYCDEVPDAIAVSLVYVPGMPIMLAGNIDLETMNVLLDMGKYEVMHRILDKAESYEEEPDGTIH